jgi:hypothetical protein
MVGVGVLGIVPETRAKGAKAPHVATPHVQQPRAAVPHHNATRSYNRYYNPNSLANQNNGPVISHLNSTLATLAKADHDYSGHRVKAMQHVNTAIRHLEPASVRNNQPNLATLYNNNSGNSGTGTGKKTMPQATSDKHLKNALQSLNSIGNYISNNGTATNHAQALKSVQQAIQELNTALSIR